MMGGGTLWARQYREGVSQSLPSRRRNLEGDPGEKTLIFLFLKKRENKGVSGPPLVSNAIIVLKKISNLLWRQKEKKKRVEREGFRSGESAFKEPPGN